MTLRWAKNLMLDAVSAFVKIGGVAVVLAVVFR